MIENKESNPSSLCASQRSQVHIWSNAKIEEKNGVSYTTAFCINCGVQSRFKL